MFTAASAGKWRTAFLSLRDEISTTPQPPVPRLLQDLIFSHSNSLLSAVSLLPPHELTSDCLFLLDLVSKADGPDWIPVSLHTCQLVRPLLHLSSIALSTLFLTLFAFVNPDTRCLCSCTCATKLIVMAALSSLFCLCLGVSSAPTNAFAPFHCIFLQSRTCDPMFRDSKVISCPTLSLSLIVFFLLTFHFLPFSQTFGRSVPEK